MDAAPDPPIYPFVDLRKFEYIPIEVQRFRDSRAGAALTGDQFRAWFMLILASWHQVPAASLPADDVELANLAGFGRMIVDWLEIKDGALYGWVLCSDGRWYHPVTAEKAINAWKERARLVYRQRKKRKQTEVQDFEDWIDGYVEECRRSVTVTKPPVTVTLEPVTVTEPPAPAAPQVEVLTAPETERPELAALELYNELAQRAGLPVAQRLNPTRSSKLKARLRECGGIEGWRIACEKIEASSFCTGGNKDGWRASLDFMLQASSFTKIMEGTYDDRRPKRPGSKAIRETMEILERS